MPGAFSSDVAGFGIYQPGQVELNAMVAAIRQTVTVRDNGRIEVMSPELRPGTVAEVIVLLGPAPTSDAQPLSPNLAVTALDDIQQSLRLDAAGAAAWSDQVRAERAAFPRDGHTPPSADPG